MKPLYAKMLKRQRGTVFPTISTGIMRLAMATFCTTAVFADEMPQKPARKDILAPLAGKRISTIVTGLEFVGDGRASVTFTEVHGPEERPVAKPGGKQIRWDYNSKGRPVPVMKGMWATVVIDNDGKIAEVYSEIHLLAYRKETNGYLEVIAKPSGAANDTARLHLRPHWIGLFTKEIPVDMVWSRKFGLMLTSTAAGGGVSEVESQARKKTGIPVNNEPGFMYAPGRDGWKLLTSEGSETIPKEQEIWAAG